ncbi:MAG: glutamyl-tRNA reductase [Candidatus Omnitrophica bacterium]|nr:glutamyl-tRNA reductase [Candidatus Omnitrophota bacterium]
MNILAVGINHKTSSIDIRERFFLQPLERELLVNELLKDPRIIEAFVLSTCNRTEIYANAIEDQPQLLMKALFKIKKVPLSADLAGHFYTLSSRQAIDHLLRVTTGLDSLVVGEKQILGQVKEAFEFSRSKGALSKTFNVLSNLVVQTGKKARHETQIDFGGSSVSWASVMMAQDILGSLQDKAVLILGSGKMGRLAVEQLAKKGVAKIYIMNRTIEKAQELARESGGIAVGIWDIKEILQQVDACICSASCTHHLIEKDLVEAAMAARPSRPLVCIDISMPRNIAPEVAEVGNVRLATVDDLDRIVESNMQKRMSAVALVEGLIDRKIDEFYKTMEKITLIKEELWKA